ncbi:MAG TPA: cation-translocating P-type ATPase [Aggregatilineales bacterium]|nr:cation-translocating P-type ATPase [Aggregatilineales bacterium]
MADFYKRSVDQILTDFKTDAERGLSTQEATARQAQHGKNKLPTGEQVTLLQVILRQFVNIMVIVLVVAAVISALLGEFTDAIVIGAVIVLNAVIGTFQEFRAEKAIEALSAMQVPKVTALRDGHATEISAEGLVPGDVVILSEGNRVPADGRLIEVKNMLVDEAALTGESQQVDKVTAALTEDGLIIGDQKNMAFMGTNVNSGRGKLVVTTIGGETELGKVAHLLATTQDTATPLQKRINDLSVLLVRGSLIVVALVFVVGLLRSINLEEMLVTSLGLAVAAVPEGLPAIITVALSLGASRMVKRRALMRRLPAVETLGSVTTICSDKTGTLTKNEMTATLIALPGEDDVKVTGIGYQPAGDFLIGDIRIDPKERPLVGDFLRAMALATDAYIEQDERTGQFNVVGDTTEGALLVAAQKGGGWTRDSLESSMPRVAEIPFESGRKAMTTFHHVKDPESALALGAEYISITKGAPDRLIEWGTHERLKESVVELTPERKARWLEYVDALASQGLRVLGVAYRSYQELPAKPNVEEHERNLKLLGLVGILDPARPEAREAVKTARAAGIRPIMITGDHALTAEAIARDLTIIDSKDRAMTGAELAKLSEDELVQVVKTTSAFARVAPEQKLQLVKALQAQGHVAAMTGDGVNDAPALKQADIGVAMGITGTEVSKGAADMVLLDDNFATIVAAVEEGRTVYDNIRKFVRYLVSSNLGEILVMFLALLVGLRIPLLAIHILWVNLITDGLPAIALGFDPAEPGIMKRKPRPVNEGIFAHGLARQVLVGAVVLMISTLAAFLYGHYANGLDPFARNLGITELSYAQIDAMIDVDAAELPADWDALSPEARAELVADEDGVESTLLAEIEKVPRTMAFTVLAFGQMFHVMGIHAGDRTSFLRTWFRRNKWLALAVLSTFVLQLIILYVPFLQALFKVVPLSLVDMGICLLLATLMLVYTELDKLGIRHLGWDSYDQRVS